MPDLTCPSCGARVDGYTQQHLDEAQLNAMHGGMDAGYQAGLAAAQEGSSVTETTFERDEWPRRIA